MKLAIVLVCALAAVQGRSVQPFDDAVDAPWLVHLRVARSTGEGFLDSCVGAIYNQRWILTSASCVENVRFAWIRYNAPNVFQPELVTETTRVTQHPEYNAETGENDIAFININRNIMLTDTIKPIAVAASDAEAPASGKACGYGATEDGRPGEDLFCANVDLEESDNLLLGSSEKKATKYDLGAPLVADNQVYGILVGVANDENAGVFLKITSYNDWIAEVTGESEEAASEDQVESEDILVAEPFFDDESVVVAEPILVAEPTF